MAKNRCEIQEGGLLVTLVFFLFTLFFLNHALESVNEKEQEKWEKLEAKKKVGS